MPKKYHLLKSRVPPPFHSVEYARYKSPRLHLSNVLGIFTGHVSATLQSTPFLVSISECSYNYSQTNTRFR